jgi:hypothetical protein
MMIKSGRIRRHVALIGEENEYRILVGKPKHRLEYNIKMDLQ